MSFPPQTRFALGCLAVVGVLASLPSQRGVRALTTIGASAPQLSPNGRSVAFKTTSNGVSALAVISVVPRSKPSILVTNKSLTHFLWTPDSAGLYYQIAATIHFIPSNGGSPKQIAKISGANPRMFDLDSKDKVIIGTRSDSAGGSAIFTVPTDGSTVAKDIKTSNNNFFGELDLAPNDTKITYTSQVAQSPFAPIEVRAIDIDGKNDVSLSGGGLPRTGVKVSLPRNLSWADAGKSVLFTAVNTDKSTWELMRITTTASTPLSLTAPPQQFQRSSVSGDLKTTVFIGTTKHGHVVPGIVPTAGGARIPLEPELNWVVVDNPSIDAAGTVVVFSGYKVGTTGRRPELQLITLDREIHVAPRPTLAAMITFQLPLGSGERGTLFLSTGLAPADPKKQFKLPGFQYAVAIDPTIILPLIAGTGNGPPLSFSATVPNDTALIGFTVYLQGLRVRAGSPPMGDFTRYAELQFLK